MQHLLKILTNIIENPNSINFYRKLKDQFVKESPEFIALDHLIKQKFENDTDKHNTNQK
jgi:hypothetical protein